MPYIPVGLLQHGSWKEDKAPDSSLLHESSRDLIVTAM